MNVRWSILAAVACLAGAGCVEEYESTLKVEPSGAATVEVRCVVSRDAAAQQVALAVPLKGDATEPVLDLIGWMLEQAEQEREAASEAQTGDAGAGAEPPAPPAADPLIDEIGAVLWPEEGTEDAGARAEKLLARIAGERPDLLLEARIRYLLARSYLSFEEGVECRVDAVRLTERSVEVRVTLAFEDLYALVGLAPKVWGNVMLGYVAIEANSGQVRLALRPTSSRFMPGKPGDQMRMRLAGYRAKGAFRIVVPGEIASSTLPEASGREALLRFDGASAESLDAVKALYDGGALAVVFDAGGMDTGDLPLTTEDALAGGVAADAGRGLPTVDADPSEVRIEPLYVSASSVRLLAPEGAALARGAESYTRIVARANLLGTARVLDRGELSVDAAEADGGRPWPEPLVARWGAERDPYGRPGAFFGGYGEDEEGAGRGLRFTVEMGPPPAGARAIGLVRGTLTAAVVDGWSERQVDTYKADAAPIDLGGLAPGLELVVLRASEEPGEWGEGQVTVKLRGPSEVAWATVELAASGDGYRDSDVLTLRRRKTSASKVFLLRYEVRESAKPPALIVRWPRRPHVMRVPFELRRLDLF